MQYTPRLLASPRVLIRRKRELPVAGENLVTVGSKIKSIDPVLRTVIKGEIRVVKVRELLGIKNENIKEFFTIKEDQNVIAGESLFKRTGLFGLFPEIIKSPVYGKIEFINYEAGHIGIRSEGKKFELNAYLSGVVREANNLSVIIESEAALIKGLYGSGGEVSGEFIYLENLKDKIVTETDIINCSKERKLESSIIAGGAQFSVDAIKKLISLKVAGFITASCPTDLAGSEILNNLVFVITEGFGLHSEKSNLSKIFKLADGESCSLSGAVQIRAGAIRPELIVHKNFTDYPLEQEDSSSKLEVGSTVRVIRGKQIGNLGQISQILSKPVFFDSGIETFSAEVDFSDGLKTICPLANLELI